MALAAGTKLNGGLAGVIFALYCIIMIFRKIVEYGFARDTIFSKIKKIATDAKIRLLLFSLIVAGISAFVVFVTMNPFLYEHPFRGMDTMVKFRMVVATQQQREHVTSTLILPMQKFLSVANRTLFPGGYVILGKIFKIPIDFILFVLGFIILLCSEIKHLLKGYDFSVKSIIILWVIITFTGITTWIPLDWERYYLPLIPCVAVVTAYAFGKIIEWSAKSLRYTNIIRRGQG